MNSGLSSMQENLSTLATMSSSLDQLSADQNSSFLGRRILVRSGDSYHEGLRILVAPAGFKEALGPEAVAAALKEGLRRVVDKDTATIVKLPLHDGGEGFCKALVAHYDGEIRELVVTGPVGEPVASYFGLVGVAKDIAVLDSKSNNHGALPKIFRDMSLQYGATSPP